MKILVCLLIIISLLKISKSFISIKHTLHRHKRISLNALTTVTGTETEAGTGTGTEAGKEAEIKPSTNKNDNDDDDSIIPEIFNRALDTVEDIYLHARRLFNPFYSQDKKIDDRPRIVIMGSGWSAHAFIKTIETDMFHVIVISPRPFFLFTPMLAGTCVGSVEYRSVVEPIRLSNPFIEYVEGEVINIDKKNCSVIANLPKIQGSDRQTSNFKVGYDHLIVASGVASSDFGLKNVSSYCHYLKEISDAKDIKQNILDCFEIASIPDTAKSEIDRLLTFAIVGGGATGVEFVGELTDFVGQDLNRLYPRLKSYVKIVLLNSSPTLLSTFDIKLQEIAFKRLTDKGVNIQNNAKVVEVTDGALKYKLKGNDNEHEVTFGACVWAAGTASRKVTKTISLELGTRQSDLFTKNGGKLAVDRFHRVIDDDETSQGNIFALGDVSASIDKACPQTAQVAAQQGAFLARQFNREYDWRASIPVTKKNMILSDPFKFYYLSFRNITFARPFKFINLGSLAYIGGSEAVAKIQIGEGFSVTSSGYEAFLLWRSVYVAKQVSARTRFLVLFDLIKSKIFGRDVTEV